jgi:hypothetical protein
MILLLALGFLGIPIAYLVVLIRLLIKADRKGLELSVLFFAVVAVTGIWAIFQSRSSTAGIGVIGIPMIGAVAGFLGLAFGRWRESPDPIRRVGGWIGLAGTLAIISYSVVQGNKTKAKNRVIDDKQVAYTASLARARDTVDAGLIQNRGHARAWLDSSIGARGNDRAFIMAALHSDSISPAVLDTLANSQDFGVVLETLRNPSTQAATLERVYRTHTNPAYFAQAVASHPNTPPAILREMYRGPKAVSGMDIAFAGNPGAPREILLDIARRNTSSSIIGVLLYNPALDCELLTESGANLKRQNRDAKDSNVVRVAYLEPTLCAKKTAK